MKFRIYDKINKVWATSNNRYLPSHNQMGSYEAIILLDGTSALHVNGNLETLDEDRYVVQQSSGFLDIENKEIYEGDIVELHLAANDKSRIPDSRGICEVYFDRAAFRMREIKRNWFLKVYNGALLGDFNVCKIIGNVFENPELLKV